MLDTVWKAEVAIFRNLGLIRVPRCRLDDCQERGRRDFSRLAQRYKYNHCRRIQSET